MGAWRGALAGALGFFATILTDVHVPDDDGSRRMTVDMVDDVSIVKARLGFLAGYAVVGLLLYCAAAWRRHVEPRVPDSTAAKLVATGFTASAGALTLGHGWKGAMAIYGDGGPGGRQLRQGGPVRLLRPQRLQRLHRLDGRHVRRAWPSRGWRSGNARSRGGSAWSPCSACSSRRGGIPGHVGAGSAGHHPPAVDDRRVLRLRLRQEPGDSAAAACLTTSRKRGRIADCRPLTRAYRISIRLRMGLRRRA
ncbi:hypothetical protein ACU686_27145 [Yinghuangia aomiensis]